MNYKAKRVHGKVIPNGTITGRMTHRNPNMAQIPGFIVRMEKTVVLVGLCQKVINY